GFWGLLARGKSPKVFVLEAESLRRRHGSTNSPEKINFPYVGDFKILGANYSASVAVPVTYFGSKIKPDVAVHDAKLTKLMRFLRNPPRLGPGGRQLTPAEIAFLKQAFQSPLVQNRIAAFKRIYGYAVRLGDLVRAFGKQMQRYTNDYQTGLGNSTLTPIALGWHFGDFHLAPSFNVIIPGTYHRDSSASPSQKFFTFMPALGLTWLPKWGLEANLMLMYDIPTINSSPLFPVPNSYQSGQGLHFDYCLDYAVKPNLRLGAAGYYYQQMTPDIADGQNIGNHAREFAIGPAIQYNPI
ncbi:MAG: transporter, partial [Deltaproteobacteria bacterium]|nr:transporter [Deltaproteobacteria bacterium]